jgi:hypothetical protein
MGKGVRCGVPEYEDLVRRAPEVRAQATALKADSRRIRELAALLRDAEAGKRLLLHCAWCDRLDVGGEWLHLEAVGSGQVRIHAAVVERATHGICPECLERVQREAEIKRSQQPSRGKPSAR